MNIRLQYPHILLYIYIYMGHCILGGFCGRMFVVIGVLHYFSSSCFFADEGWLCHGKMHRYLGYTMKFESSGQVNEVSGDHDTRTLEFVYPSNQKVDIIKLATRQSKTHNFNIRNCLDVIH